MREMAYLEIAEKLENSGKIHIANIHNLLKPYLFQYFLNIGMLLPHLYLVLGGFAIYQQRSLDLVACIKPLKPNRHKIQ